MKEDIHIKFDNGSEIETILCVDVARSKSREEYLKFVVDEVCKWDCLKWHQKLLIKYWYGSRVYSFIYDLFGGRY